MKKKKDCTLLVVSVWLSKSKEKERVSGGKRELNWESDEESEILGFRINQPYN